MSRVAKAPVAIPGEVAVDISGQNIHVKGPKGELRLQVHPNVEFKQADGQLLFTAKDGSKQSRALSGTMRSLAQNMVSGVTRGFERKLLLNGVGYRAKASDGSLNLVLGFSHPIDYSLPEGVTAQTPSNTEIVLSSIDKQLLGEVAAQIRSFRPPEPYKGKGVCYADETIRRKETKKK